MIGRKTVFALGAPLVLGGLLGLTWMVQAPRISASLYGLLGQQEERIPKFVREATAAEASVLVSAGDGTAARSAAKRIGERLGADRLAQDGKIGGAALEFIRENRAGLVCAETASLLETAEGRAKIARRALRRLYASPLPPILGFADDPFGLTDGFLATLLPKPMAKTEEGDALLVTNGVTHVLIRLQLNDATVSDIDRTIAWLEKTSAACDETMRERNGSVAARLAGAPVHTAVSARRCKGEIGLLTWFSLAVIAGLAIFVFRSVKWLPLLAGSLLTAALGGSLALIALFREIHVMTLVMGTTVLGLVIDYSFHWLLSDAAAKPAVKKGLLVSFATTEISLVPLMLATIPVLRQSAVFLCVGLAAALGYVWAGYPCGGATRNASASERLCANSKPRLRKKCFLFLFTLIGLIALCGLFRTEMRTDVAALYCPPSELLEAEKLRAAFGTFDLSAVPRLADRRRIAARVEQLYSEQGAAVAKTLGLARLVPPAAPRDLLLQPKVLMDEIFSVWTHEALRRLGWSVLAIFAVVAVFCRRRALRTLAPPLIALGVVAGCLGWAGQAINLFHLLAAFLLLGMGIDYAVFLQSGERSAFRPALCSLLTSVAGFGALAFVSFPVVRAFGVVLGVGLPVAFVAALLVGKTVAKPADAFETNASTEHGATLLGMETLLVLYRVFGLRVLHFFAAGVGLCVWLFTPAVRRASPSVRKVLLFTRSLADKLVVLADGRSLPQVVTDGSPDAEAFLADVRSGKGVFVLSSHVGTVEVLTALGACERTFHAWMDFDRTSVFNRFYLRHARKRRVVIHPISEFGMGTVFEAGDWIDGGDCLVMAGDRGAGAFRFAAAFDHPVYFVACLAERDCRYRAVIRRLPADCVTMESAYGQIVSDLARANSAQHFVWNAPDVV